MLAIVVDACWFALALHGQNQGGMLRTRLVCPQLRY
jgi:hypothetical protein